MISGENDSEKKKQKIDDMVAKEVSKKIIPLPICSKPKLNPMALTNFFSKLPPGTTAPSIKLNLIPKKQNDQEMKKSKSKENTNSLTNRCKPISKSTKEQKVKTQKEQVKKTTETETVKKSASKSKSKAKTKKDSNGKKDGQKKSQKSKEIKIEETYGPQ